jgi:hypothetical protein
MYTPRNLLISPRNLSATRHSTGTGRITRIEAAIIYETKELLAASRRAFEIGPIGVAVFVKRGHIILLAEGGAEVALGVWGLTHIWMGFSGGWVRK